ncbi:hypothetical protein HMPREF0765_0857 [Sphingobacterium spiritivorum ATCC 33300]|uniref:Uncharacterized protein n=1 Tax=Sphingobacterium spiritivorum ATCC 33300 TaxID=525372 RepID=C2FU51_SPHSI|nr:hypothetical protein HMPREF0765_0857 [Sphingobacterium spiritivorum ATCC 33300]
MNKVSYVNNLIFNGHMEYPNYIHSYLCSLYYMDISYVNNLLFKKVTLLCSIQQAVTST